MVPATRSREILSTLECEPLIMAARYQGWKLDPNQFSERVDGKDVMLGCKRSPLRRKKAACGRARSKYPIDTSRVSRSPALSSFCFWMARQRFKTGPMRGEKVVFLNDQIAGEGAAPTAVDELRLLDVESGR